MAAGITEPATTLLAEDSAHADAGGDGFFDEADFLAKFPARFTDLGTVPSKSFRCLDSMQNGDGVGSAVTALRFRDCSIKFDSAKSYAVSTLGGSGRKTYLGEKVGAASVWKGANLEFTGGGSITIRGSLFMYDSRIYHATQAIAIRPAVAGGGEIIQGTIEMRGSTLSFLGESGFPFGPIRSLNLIHKVTTVNTTLNIPDCLGLTVYPIAGSSYGLRPSGTLSVKGLAIASGGQSIADIFPISSSVDWDMNDVTWSQLVPGLIAPQSAGFNIWEGATSVFLVVDPRTMTPLANVALEIVDRFGVTVVDVDTDAAGQVTYNSGSRLDCLRFVRNYQAAGLLVQEDQFPWTVHVNHKRAIKTNFLPLTFRLVPSYMAYAGGRQFFPIGLQIELVPLGGSIEEWRSGLA